MNSIRKRRLFIFTAFMSLLTACDTGPHELRLVTPTEPVDRSIVEEFSDLLDNNASVRIRLTATPLSEEAALDAVQSGEADVALVSNNLPFHADIATVMPLYPTVLHIGRRDGPSNLFGLEMLRLRPALAAKRPGLFQQLSGDFDTSRSTYIVHAGTQAYLQRSAPSVYERYSGIAEVVVTLIVALGSASIAAVRIFRRLRKNRIDRFYTQAIALRRSLTESSDPAEIERVVNKVRGLQNQAYDLLVDEKLAADESFRIFIALSNDVLRQLGATGEQVGISDA